MQQQPARETHAPNNSNTRLLKHWSMAPMAPAAPRGKPGKNKWYRIVGTRTLCLHYALPSPPQLSYERPHTQEAEASVRTHQKIPRTAGTSTGRPGQRHMKHYSIARLASD